MALRGESKISHLVSHLREKNVEKRKKREKKRKRKRRREEEQKGMDSSKIWYGSLDFLYGTLWNSKVLYG